MINKKIILSRTSGPSAIGSMMFSNEPNKRVPDGEDVMFICDAKLWHELGSPEEIVVTMEPSP